MEDGIINEMGPKGVRKLTRASKEFTMSVRAARKSGESFMCSSKPVRVKLKKKGFNNARERREDLRTYRWMTVWQQEAWCHST
jgi:hypothetical protein